MGIAVFLLLAAVIGRASTAFSLLGCGSSHASVKLLGSLNDNNIDNRKTNSSRRDFVGTAASLVAGIGISAGVGCYPQTAKAAAALQDSLDIENFLKTGVDSGGNMGVSSQAGKSRPQTGVVFRDGSEVSQDSHGNVAAEILTGTKASPKAVLVSFVCPQWKLETGPVFDVECRDKQTGDGAFLAVTQSTNGKKLSDLPSAFFLDRLFDPTGRFSFYGPPTDIRVKSSYMMDVNRRVIEVSFSNLSQSTSAEIPRKAILVATLPEGTDNAVVLVGSAKAVRWKKANAEDAVRQTVESFRAAAAPKSSLKLRSKDRSNTLDF